nr:putative NUDIX domain-containing protein [uncultured bacterium]
MTNDRPNTEPALLDAEPVDTADLVANAAAQLVEHVDEHGNVIEVVTRAEMRDRCLRHRSVYVAVLDSNDRLLVHKRADWKDVFPGAWDLAFGGICDVGEDWAASAQRELMEEAGVHGELADHGPVFFEASGVALVGRFYVCRHDGPFVFNDGEVTDSRWVPLDELADFIERHEVPPDSSLVVTSLNDKAL